MHAPSLQKWHTFDLGITLMMRGLELQISEIFEARQVHIAPIIEDFEGMSRRNWLQLQ